MSEPLHATQIEGDALTVDVQVELSDDEPEEPPSSDDLTRWARAAYAAVSQDSAELTVRITDAEEMAELNQSYRGKPGTTNVLSFPFDSENLPPDLQLGLLGDVVICHQVTVEEAASKSVSLQAHYAHLVTHGVLHLCGFDHQEEEPARIMEALETNILQRQGFSDPYA